MSGFKMFWCICYWNMTQRATFLSQGLNAAFPFSRRGSNSGNPNTRLQSCSKHTSKGGIIACLNKSEPKCAEAAEELSLTHFPPAITCWPFIFIRSGKFPSPFPHFLKCLFKKKKKTPLGWTRMTSLYLYPHSFGGVTDLRLPVSDKAFCFGLGLQAPRSLWSVFENTSLKCYGEVAPY